MVELVPRDDWGGEYCMGNSKIGFFSSWETTNGWRLLLCDSMAFCFSLGAGLLGVTIKLDNYGGADERLVRVLEVEEHSPAAGESE